MKNNLIGLTLAVLIVLFACVTVQPVPAQETPNSCYSGIDMSTATSGHYDPPWVNNDYKLPVTVEQWSGFTSLEMTPIDLAINFRSKLGYSTIISPVWFIQDVNGVVMVFTTNKAPNQYIAYYADTSMTQWLCPPVRFSKASFVAGVVNAD